MGTEVDTRGSVTEGAMAVTTPPELDKGSGKLGAAGPLSGVVGVLGVMGRLCIGKDDQKDGLVTDSRLGVRKRGEVIPVRSPKLGTLWRCSGENRLGVPGERRKGDSNGERLDAGDSDDISILLSPSSNISKKNGGISAGLSSFTASTLSVCRVEIVRKSVTYNQRWVSVSRDPLRGGITQWCYLSCDLCLLSYLRE